MTKTTIKDLLNLSVEWTVKISHFYADFRGVCSDISFMNLLKTMIDQEGQYTKYYEENLTKLDFKTDFIIKEDDYIEFDNIFEDIPGIAGMSKINFLKKAVHFQDISIKTCEYLGELSKTNKSKQIFKELSDEENRHMGIFKDHLELEELF
jgi:hypothetical protein